MITLLTFVGMVLWILATASLYGLCEGKDMQSCRKEATGFACFSGLIAIGVILLLGAAG